MSDHPLNLAVRFLLELALLASMAYWGWTQHTGAMRFAAGFGAPIVAAAVWAIFRVPGDGGDPVVVTPGRIRLLIEAVLFGLGIAGLFAAGRPRLGVALGIITAFHYAVSYDRIGRFLR